MIEKKTHKPDGQHQRIIRYLRQGRHLSLINSFEAVGVMALSQRIGELIKEGYPIRRGRMTTKSGAMIGKYEWIFEQQCELKL